MMLVQEHMKDILKEFQEKMDQKLEALTRETQKSLKEIQENTKANKEEMQKTIKEIQENFGQQAEVMKDETQKSLKEIQENLGQQAEVMKEKTQKSLKELQESTNKHVKDLNKTIQDLKSEVETTKKTQRETTLEIESLGKKSGDRDANINNRIQEIEERISDAEDSIETMDSTVNENAKCKRLVTQNIQEIQDTMSRPNLRTIGIDESEDLQLKGPANIFNKIMEENFPNLKRGMPMNIQEAHRTPNRLDQNRNTSCQ